MALLKKLSLPLFFFLWSCLTIESWGLIASSNRDGIIIDEDYNASFPNDTYIDRRAFPDNFKFGALTWAFKVYVSKYNSTLYVLVLNLCIDSNL